MELAGTEGSPSIERFRNYHALRVAARRDPIAAYNLGNHMSGGGMQRSRSSHQRRSMQLFERCIDMVMERVDNPSAAPGKFPRAEREARDVASRSMTNVGARVANRGYPDRAVEHFSQAIAFFPDNSNAHVCLGNMGVYHSMKTGVDPMEGIAEWETAARLGDYCWLFVIRG